VLGQSPWPLVQLHIPEIVEAINAARGQFRRDRHSSSAEEALHTPPLNFSGLPLTYASHPDLFNKTLEDRLGIRLVNSSSCRGSVSDEKFSLIVR